MNRKWDRIWARIGGIWNIINGAITLFLYSPWIKNNLFTTMNGDTKGLNYVSESVNSVVIIYGLIYFLMGAINLYLVNRLEDDTIQHKIPIWYCIFGFASYLMVDPISTITFVISGVFGLARNKALRQRNVI